MENIEKCERKLIKDWNDLVGLENEKYILEINTDMGCGWIRDKSDYSDVAYLSTHTFYGSKYKFSTKLLNSYGFNVELIIGIRVVRMADIIKFIKVLPSCLWRTVKHAYKTNFWEWWL